MKKKKYVVVLLIAISCGVLLWHYLSHTKPVGVYAFKKAVEQGYSGTQEEWIASLAGETLMTSDSTIQTSYDLACEKGYTGSYSVWMKELTGIETHKKKSAFQLMQENGYTGTLTQWLNSLVEDPESLGHSPDGGKTDYERACEYGFEGTFIDWVVSLINQQ